MGAVDDVVVSSNQNDGDKVGDKVSKTEIVAKDKKARNLDSKNAKV